jgi:nucleoside-diphosphate-sugar epimerase
MKVLVTGATGFFGPAIVDTLRAAGHHVIRAARAPGAGHDAVRMDIIDPSSCARAFDAHRGIEAVVHAAALAHVPAGRTAEALCRTTNVAGTRHVLDAAAAAGVRQFVFISSVMVYGDYDLPARVDEDTTPRQTGIYGAAKADAEALVDDRRGSMDTWRLRMASMYSPDWLVNIRKRVAPPVLGRVLHVAIDPHGRRYSLCSRRNGAETVRHVIEGRVPTGVYNVSDQYEYSQAEIRAAVVRGGEARPEVRVPVGLIRAVASLSVALPGAARHAVRSRYWKFCERNVYPSDRLAACGVILPPDLAGPDQPECH